MTEVPWEGAVEQLHAEGVPWSVEDHVRRLGRRLVRTATAATHRWVLEVVIPQIEEHVSEPAERWDALKDALRARSKKA